jgi:hypothetical protein
MKLKVMYIILSVIFLILTLIRGIGLIYGLSTGGINFMTVTEIISYVFWFFVVLFLGVLFAILAARRKTNRQLVCPNGCAITQTGSKFCGQCGSRLVRK